MDAKIHILVIPYPIQGHINPMLQFSKRLASKGTRATLVTTTTISKSMQARPNLVEIESVNDGFNENKKPESVDAFIENFRVVISESLAPIINKHRTSGYPVKVLVYDSMAPWALDLAHQLGLCAAAFFTQSCGVDAIYYHMQQGTLKIPNPKEEGSSSMLVSIPSLPLLAVNDLPDLHLYPLLLSDNISQFSNFQKAD
ncbi:unnamed protein product [Ilex paraguariensis]|uniref:Glycosyltransferase N-terminal domain-containing protein n=1 Tax=Ilex paraguariensis TaxID=185542 RepID=A0ABC8UYE7_9AQUA